MPDKLNDSDLQVAAAPPNCDVPAIKAVAEVESAGDGFSAGVDKPEVSMIRTDAAYAVANEGGLP